MAFEIPQETNRRSPGGPAPGARAASPPWQRGGALGAGAAAGEGTCRCAEHGQGPQTKLDRTGSPVPFWGDVTDAFSVE